MTAFSAITLDIISFLHISVHWLFTLSHVFTFQCIDYSHYLMSSHFSALTVHIISCLHISVHWLFTLSPVFTFQCSDCLISWHFIAMIVSISDISTFQCIDCSHFSVMTTSPSICLSVSMWEMQEADQRNGHLAKRKISHVVTGLWVKISFDYFHTLVGLSLRNNKAKICSIKKC